MCNKLLLPTCASNTFGIDSLSVGSGGYTSWNQNEKIQFHRILNQSRKKKKSILNRLPFPCELNLVYQIDQYQDM